MSQNSERGSVTVFFSLTAVALFLAAGLVATGGEKVIALNQASQVADAAARAGAQAVDLDFYLTTGQVRVEPERATAQVNQFLAATGRSGTVTVTEATITVTVTLTIPRVLLPGDPITVSAVGTATAVSEATAP